MRGSPFRTISSRIVVGFFVLTATFGAVSVYITVKVDDIGRELRFLREAYLEVSFRVAQVQSRQALVVDYLDSTGLLDPRLRPGIRNNLDERRRLLGECKELLQTLGDVPDRHRNRIEKIRERLDFFLGEYETNQKLYDVAFSAEGEVAETALTDVEQRERKLSQQNQRWFQTLRDGVSNATAELAEVGETARKRSLVLGAFAFLIGLLVTVWAVLTLRPLRRLRDGARRIARGEYHERVEVAGETEVAEVAKEFNSMAEAVQERERELVRNARLAAMGKMAAVITHELRNPLSSIGLNAELVEEALADSGAPQDATDLCRTIHKEVDRLTAITEDYLRFSRLPRPKLDLEQLNATITGLLGFLKEELDQANVRVSVELDDDLPQVLVDEGQLRQAFLNLIRNAADAMTPDGGDLLVATERQGDGGVRVRIVDSGPGIASEQLADIFEPFFSTKEGGTGLGLALTHQIISEHGGTIRADCPPQPDGQGTAFVIDLPASA